MPIIPPPFYGLFFGRQDPVYQDPVANALAVGQARAQADMRSVLTGPLMDTLVNAMLTMHNNSLGGRFGPVPFSLTFPFFSLANFSLSWAYGQNRVFRTAEVYSQRPCVLSDRGSSSHESRL